MHRSRDGGLLKFTRSQYFNLLIQAQQIHSCFENLLLWQLRDFSLSPNCIQKRFCQSEQPLAQSQNDEKCMHLLHAKRGGSTGCNFCLARKSQFHWITKLRIEWNKGGTHSRNLSCESMVNYVSEYEMSYKSGCTMRRVSTSCAFNSNVCAAHLHISKRAASSFVWQWR